eukprot:2802089-Ditylum_brightwellii.AAC.1
MVGHGVRECVLVAGFPVGGKESPDDRNGPGGQGRAGRAVRVHCLGVHGLGVTPGDGYLAFQKLVPAYTVLAFDCIDQNNFYLINDYCFDACSHFKSVEIQAQLVQCCCPGTQSLIRAALEDKMVVG